MRDTAKQLLRKFHLVKVNIFNVLLFHIATTIQLQIISVSSLVASHCNGHTSSCGNLLLLGGDEHNIYNKFVPCIRQ